MLFNANLENIIKPWDWWMRVWRDVSIFVGQGGARDAGL